MPRCVWMLVPALAFWSAGCGKPNPDEVGPSDSPVRVEVTNHHALPMEIYALSHGTSQRLGTVHPGMEAQFAISANLTRQGSVELQVLPNASTQRFSSGDLLLAPGTIVELIISPQLFNSTATLRPKS